MATWTPPFPVVLATAEPELAAALAPAFAAADGVNGQVAAARAFAAALSRPTVVRMSELQYRLDEVVDPPMPPGAARLIAGDDDLRVAAAWFEAFVVESGAPGRDHRASIEHRLRSGGGVWFWEVDGVPVSLVGRHPASGGAARIGPVYTPPEQRGRGYAAALTATVVRDALDRGARALTLFTDAANHTSNGVYQRIGFREIASIVDLRFGDLPRG